MAPAPHYTRVAGRLLQRLEAAATNTHGPRGIVVVTALNPILHLLQLADVSPVCSLAQRVPSCSVPMATSHLQTAARMLQW